MKKIWDRVSRIWCENFHPAPTWPIYGRCLCRKCGRVIPVPWANSEAWMPPVEERRSRGQAAPALVIQRFVEQ